MARNEVVGRILEADINNARCEFSSGVQAGDPVVVKIGDTEYKARIEHLETTPMLGLQGWIVFLQRPNHPPRVMTPVLKGEVEGGGILSFGRDYRGNEIKLNVNPLFTHVLNAGMPQQGKTHGMLVLLEELAEHGVPCIVFDTQGEFVNLPAVRKQAIVVEDISIRDLIAHLQSKRIIIVNLLGLTNPVKASKVAALISQFIVEKERDYAQAENDAMLLQIPPTLIFIDEAEIFVPKVGMRGKAYGPSAIAIEEVAKRGSKLGMGLIVAVQRVSTLAIDVRDNCSSVIAFRIVGRSNRMSLSSISFFTQGTIDRLKGLMKGECVLLGPLGGGSRAVMVRDIITQRAKETDFEKILGLTPGSPVEFVPSIVMSENGKIVDNYTKTVLVTKVERTLREDKMVSEAAGGDGVVKRTEPLPDELIEALKLETDEDESLEQAE